MNDATPPGIGDNLPPTDYSVITALLEEKHGDVTARRDELLAGVGRMPETIDDDETAHKAADFLSKQIRPAVKSAEALRVTAKEPYLSGGRAVDGFFSGIAVPLTKAMKDIDAKLTVFDRKVAAEAKRIAEAQARQAIADAKAAAEEAERQAAAMRDDDALDVAVAAATAAADAKADSVVAERAAGDNLAGFSRQKSDHGTTRSLRTTWDFKLGHRDNLDLEVLRHHLSLEAVEKAVRSFVKAGGRKLAGASIFERSDTVTR